MPERQTQGLPTINMIDVSNTLFIIVLIIALVLFWSISEVIVAQFFGTLIMLPMFGILYFYAKENARLTEK